MTARTSLGAALTAWRRIVGAEHVVTEPAALDQASTATYRTHPRVAAIVRLLTAESFRRDLTATKLWTFA